jgi:tetratricopeptide (TPR) repeat protein
LLGVAALLTSCSATTEERLSIARDRFLKCEYHKAIAAYESILNSGTPLRYRSPGDPDQLSLGSQLACAHVLNMDGGQAIAVAEQTLREDPNDPVAVAVLGQAQLLVGDLVNAKVNLQRSSAAGVRHGCDWLSALYLAEKDLDNAEAALETSIAIDPVEGLARHWMIMIQCLKGDQEAALGEFDILLRVVKFWDQSAILKYDESSDLYYHAVISLTKGELDGASEQATELIRKGPLWKSAGYYLLGFISLLRADQAEAVELFDRASRGSSGFNPNIWLAGLHAYQGDTENSFRAYVAALRSQEKIQPRTGQADDLLGVVLFHVLTAVQHQAEAEWQQQMYQLPQSFGRRY